MHKFCILFLPAIATMAQDWTVMGQGSVRLVGSTLTFSYPLQPKQLALIARPAPSEIAQLARLRFRIKTDHDTAMAVLLSEKKPGGGNYTAIVWSPANAWQQVELTPADFSVSDGPNDPWTLMASSISTPWKVLGLPISRSFFFRSQKIPIFQS